MVLEEIQNTSAVLEQVPSMGFDALRPILAEHGLSDVGTLGEVLARATTALEGKIKAAGEGGGLSKFGEKAARMLFRMCDKVWVCDASTLKRVVVPFSPPLT